MKVALLIHEDLEPPNKKIVRRSGVWNDEPWLSEYDVQNALLDLGHDVHLIKAEADLRLVRARIDQISPAIIFNLLEEFHGEAIFDQHIVSFLELLQFSYTGCNPKGLTLARDKALAKKILSYHGINCPRFEVFNKGQRVEDSKLVYPTIVKCLNEEASLGLAQASVVSDLEQLKNRVEYIHEKFNTPVIAEEFIEGNEFFVGLLGNMRVTALPVWQLFFGEGSSEVANIYSKNAKFNLDYRKRHGIGTGPAEISQELQHKIQAVAKQAYIMLGLTGYARVDLRVTSDEKIYVIEANPNPDISEFDDFAASALKAGISYPELISKILRLGRRHSRLLNVG